jgi:hypothetical protein
MSLLIYGQGILAAQINGHWQGHVGGIVMWYGPNPEECEQIYH